MYPRINSITYVYVDDGDKRFGCWNENICKIRKTQQQEEPEVLDAINKIVSLKSSM